MVATALVAVTSGACSVLFATTKEQCATDGDCTARGAGFDDLVQRHVHTVLLADGGGVDGQPAVVLGEVACHVQFGRSRK